MPPPISESEIAKLTSAIVNLDSKVTQLTLRLTGDSSLQTTGLIHEVSESRKSLVELSDDAKDQRHRLETIERQNAEQAGMLDDLRFLRALTDKVWKIAGILIAGGVLHPVVVALIQHAVSGSK